MQAGVSEEVFTKPELFFPERVVHTKQAFYRTIEFETGHTQVLVFLLKVKVGRH